MPHPARALGLAVLLLALMAAPAPAQVAPDQRWMEFHTEHFRVLFPPELEDLARRAGARAERAYRLLEETLVPGPSRIDLIVSDDVDLANGMASPFPRPRVIVWANPPTTVQALSFYDDWLDLLIIHELVHVFHLEHRSRGWRAMSVLLGRNPFAFPQLWTAGWVLEGLAVYYESLLTEAGRVKGTHHDMLLRTALLEDRFFTLDRATGDPIRWPGGSTRYVYGSLFVDHLARTYGAETIPAFVEEAGGLWLPFRLNAPARRVFGVSFDRAWEEWSDSLRVRFGAQADTIRAAGLTVPEIVAREQRFVGHPRYRPDGGALLYMAATGVDEPSARLVGSDGAVRVLGRVSGLAGASWRRDGTGFLTAQLDLADRHRIFSDLYEMDGAGALRRITRNARVWEPDLHPDGRTAVAVGNARGTNRLLLLEVETGGERELAAPDMGVHWSAPRWSPDGSRIAAARWSQGGVYSIVILTPEGEGVRTLVSDRAVNGAPTWSPDGRFVVFTSDRTGVTNLHAAEVESGAILQVTNLLSGGFQPDVSPDGEWIAFAHYHADGYDIARVPFAPGEWRPATPLRAGLEVVRAEPPRALVPVEERATAPARRYSAVRDLLPWTWIPAVDELAGVGMGYGGLVLGSDQIGRHEYMAQGLYYPSGGRFEGSIQWEYNGLGDPQLSALLEQDWRVQLPPGTPIGNPPSDTLRTAVLRRDRSAAAGVGWSWPRWNRHLSLGVVGEMTERSRLWDEPALAPAGVRLTQFPTEAAVAVRGALSTTRGFGLVYGPQQGWGVATTVSGHRYLSPFDGETGTRGYTRVIGRTRAYQPLGLRTFARDVLALRLDGGVEAGSTSPGFEVGGTGAGVAAGQLAVGALGTGIGFPVRGYAAAEQTGDRALVATAEYRAPLALVERGVRLVPAFLSRVTANAFVDAGTAWCGGAHCDRFPAAGRSPSPLVSIGAEAVAELRFGFMFDLPLRVGFALPLSEGRDPALYLRAGRSF
jgi:hypothetical protein